MPARTSPSCVNLRARWASRIVEAPFERVQVLRLDALSALDLYGIPGVRLIIGLPDADELRAADRHRVAREARLRSRSKSRAKDTTSSNRMPRPEVTLMSRDERMQKPPERDAPPVPVESGKRRRRAFGEAAAPSSTGAASSTTRHNSSAVDAAWSTSHRANDDSSPSGSAVAESRAHRVKKQSDICLKEAKTKEQGHSSGSTVMDRKRYRVNRELVKSEKSLLPGMHDVSPAGSTVVDSK